MASSTLVTFLIFAYVTLKLIPYILRTISPYVVLNLMADLMVSIIIFISYIITGLIISAI